MISTVKRIVNVRFQGSPKHYAYYTDDASVTEGDFVLVMTPDRGDGFVIDQRSPKVVKVFSTEETVDGIMQAREWIVCKLDFSGWQARKEQEAKREILIAKIRRAKQDAIAAMEFADLAAKSPELSALVAELQALA